MNTASWIILAIVVAIVALIIRSTFFKGKSGCGCHCAGEEAEDKTGNPGNMPGAHCAGCQGKGSACSSCPVMENVLQPTIKYLDEHGDYR